VDERLLSPSLYRMEGRNVTFIDSRLSVSKRGLQNPDDLAAEMLSSISNERR
jgi:hypothetical protein